MSRSPRHDPEPQLNDDVVDELAKTMRLAVGALDHPDLPDHELERLCDEALSQQATPAKDEVLASSAATGCAA